jgi:hypothetical protein
MSATSDQEVPSYSSVFPDTGVPPLPPPDIRAEVCIPETAPVLGLEVFISAPAVQEVPLYRLEEVPDPPAVKPAV